MISGELNRVVVELLQQLLFWQERQKAQDPLKAAKKKRLVSGLRLALHFVAMQVPMHACKWAYRIYRMQGLTVCKWAYRMRSYKALVRHEQAADSIFGLVEL